MSRLIGPMFEGDSLMILPVVGLSLFVIVFVSICIRTYSRKPEAYRALANQPLDD